MYGTFPTKFRIKKHGTQWQSNEKEDWISTSELLTSLHHVAMILPLLKEKEMLENMMAPSIWSENIYEKVRKEAIQLSTLSNVSSNEVLVENNDSNYNNEFENKETQPQPENIWDTLSCLEYQTVFDASGDFKDISFENSDIFALDIEKDVSHTPLQTLENIQCKASNETSNEATKETTNEKKEHFKFWTDVLPYSEISQQHALSKQRGICDLLQEIILMRQISMEQYKSYDNLFKTILEVGCDDPVWWKFYCNVQNILS